MFYNLIKLLIVELAECLWEEIKEERHTAIDAEVKKYIQNNLNIFFFG